MPHAAVDHIEAPTTTFGTIKLAVDLEEREGTTWWCRLFRAGGRR
jgi:hypothetical protein